MNQASRRPLTQHALLCALCIVTWAALMASSAQAVVDAQLNLRYNNPADESAGGTWDLLLQSSAPNGTSAVQALIQGATRVTGIDSPSDAVIPNNEVWNNDTNVFRFQPLSGGVVELVGGDDLVPPLVLGVGTGIGSPGNIPEDDLFSNETADDRWDNSALIASGTFGSSRPSLTISANEFSGTSAVSALVGKVVVRGDSAIDGSGFEEMLLGDVDRSGTVNNNDFNAVINNYSSAGNTWDSGDIDGSSTGEVNDDDLNTVLDNFYQSAPNPANLTAAPESSARLAAATANSFALKVEVGAAFDLDSNSVAVPDISQSVGSPLIYRIDFKIETSDLASDVLGFANVGFNVDTENLSEGSAGWSPTTEVVDTPEGSQPLFVVNQDAGAPDDLQGILASIAGSLTDPNDPRTQVGQGGLTTIGSVFVEWDGVTLASISTDNVLFSANSVGGQFLASISGESASIVFGAVPEPTTFAMASLAIIGLFVRRRES